MDNADHRAIMQQATLTLNEALNGKDSSTKKYNFVLLALPIEAENIAACLSNMGMSEAIDFIKNFALALETPKGKSALAELTSGRLH